MLIQFILSAVLLCAVAMTWRRVRQRAIRRVEGGGWTMVWMVAGAVIWQPDLTTRLAQFVGIGRGADLILYGSVIVLLLLVFHLHVAHDRLEKQLTEVIRRDALREFDIQLHVQAKENERT